MSEISLEDRYTVPGRHWHLLDDGRVQCDVCPRACRLHEGQRGLCFVRGRVADQVVLTSYGRSSGFCVDPIEKKPLNHFLPGSAVLSFGTAGCNLACRFCQNWDISKSREIDRLSDAAGPDDIAEAAVRLGCRSVAMTYNDPVIFLEYAVDVADACRARGIKAVAVTAGYLTGAPRRELFAHLDAANVDLKAFTDDFYRRTCAAQPAAGAGHPGVPAAADRRVVRDHHVADPRAQRLGCRDRRRVRLARRQPRRATSRCTSPRSTPTSRCATFLRRRRPRCGGPGRSRWDTGCGSSTPATFTTPRAVGPSVRAAAPRWWSGTGTASTATGSPTTDAAPDAATVLPGRFDGPVERWGPRRVPVSITSRPRT